MKDVVTFADRKEAGEILASRLGKFKGTPDLIVLGLPRGGVIVAAAIAGALKCALDVLLVRKIGAPGNPELAAGAVSESGEVVLNDDVVTAFRLEKEYLGREIARQRAEIERQSAAYRNEHSGVHVERKTVILADDGVATGATFKAAVSCVRKERPAKLVAALPVAPPEAVSEIGALVDEIVCLHAPSGFGAVGRYYADFSQVSDAEVAAALSKR